METTVFGSDDINGRDNTDGSIPVRIVSEFPEPFGLTHQVLAGVETNQKESAFNAPITTEMSSGKRCVKTIEDSAS